MSQEALEREIVEIRRQIAELKGAHAPMVRTKTKADSETIPFRD
jgi:hypothetical protein